MKRDWIGQALADAKVVELRHQHGDRWISGLFDSADAIRQVVAELGSVGNLYSTLNAPRDAEVGNAMTASALRDDDISVVVRIPFDFDPVRPAGTASTAAELALARRQRDRLVSMLSAFSWPLPAVATSGNGAHAVYRCRMPNTPELRDILAALYRGLKSEFSDESVQFDSTVRNPARIWRLYGTLNRKGTPTPDRPHRQSVVVVPVRWEGVAPRQVEQLANKYARRATPRSSTPTSKIFVIGAGDYRTLDIVAWLSAHGLYKRALGEGKHAIACPWMNEHTTPSTPLSTDTVVWQATGDRWPTFHCSHAHCEGRGLSEVMQVLGDADRYCGRAWQRAAA